MRLTSSYANLAVFSSSFLLTKGSDWLYLRLTLLPHDLPHAVLCLCMSSRERYYACGLRNTMSSGEIFKSKRLKLM